MTAKPPLPPATDANGHLLWRNWSGSQSAYPAARAAPASEDELANLLKSAATPVRAVGAGHSFTALVPTEGTLVSLDQLSGIVSHDDGKLQSTIRAGTRLGALGPALADIGQEMLTLPDINKQALGGALATGTHGTGQTLQAIHGAVQSFRLVTAKGDIVEASRDANTEIFQAARVGLGAFGILTAVTLQNRVLTRIRKRVYALPTHDALDAWPTLKAQHRNAELYILPFTGMTAVIIGDATTDKVVPRGPDSDVDTLLDLKALRDWLAVLPPLRRYIARKAIETTPPTDAVDDGWKLLSNERPVRFNEMEYHLPAEAQPQASLEILQAVEANRPDVFFPFELRSIAPDDAYLSPFYNRASGSIAVHAYYRNDYSFLFEIVEPILRRHGGRPHWGKLNSLVARDFAALYPRWKDAVQVRQTLDPDGKCSTPICGRFFFDA
ncbi:MAG: D-arabinono-1,4-lactone oxidase [Rhodospirillales bacterium]